MSLKYQRPEWGWVTQHQNSSKFTCSLGFLCFELWSKLPSLYCTGCTPKRRGFSFWSFLLSSSADRKWGNDCNQGMEECKHACRRGKLQHVVVTCDYWASQLLSSPVQLARNAVNIIHSMAILILHSLKIFFLGGSPIIPDFVATLFSNHIGNVFKTVWLEPLFFCPLSTDRARKWDTFSAILKAVFLCYALVDANLSISHFCENCLCNVIFLLSQQISCPLQSTPFWVVRKQSVSWHFNRKTVSVERNKIFFFF